MTEEEQWLIEEMNRCTMVLEDFISTYYHQLFEIYGQTVRSNENYFLQIISCTKSNILVDLNQLRLDFKQLGNLADELCILCNNSSDSTLNIRELSQKKLKFSQEIEIYQLLNHLIQFANLEYQEAYQTTIYKRMVDCIFQSIHKNYSSKAIVMDVLLDVKNFLSSLTEKEKGSLIVEHFTINYSRNQGIFITSLSFSRGAGFYQLESRIFGIVMQLLEGEYFSLSIEEKIQKLGWIYKTDFYKGKMKEKVIGTT